MTNRWKVWALTAGATAILLTGAASGEKSGDGKSTQPFFHQFLIPGDPLDERLLAQERLVAENPDSAALRNDYGNLLAERRFAKEARAEYTKALQLDPHFFVAPYNLGLLEETEGRASAAISAYKKAIALRRGFPPAHFRLGRLYEIQGRNDDAIAEYAKAIRIDSSMRDPRHNPLVVDSRLMELASLSNYPRDVARASLGQEAAYVDVARFRPVPVDRTLASEEVVEEAGPQTIETRKTGPATGNRAPAPAAGRPTPPPRSPVRPGRREMRPGEPVSPVPTPIPPEPVQPPEPEPEPEPQR
jgi:tetratricopeptide (TPR) repeat protein